MRKLNPSVLLITFLSFYGPLPSAWAANFDQQEYQQLLNKASQKQFVRVLVNLDVDVPLAPPQKQPAAVKKQLAEVEAGLLTELGNTVLKSVRWKNGLAS